MEIIEGCIELSREENNTMMEVMGWTDEYFKTLVDENGNEIKEELVRPDNVPEEDWNELTRSEKLDRISGKNDIPEGWLDWNTLSLDQMADYLDKKYMFSSSGDALCIFKLIEFYRKYKAHAMQPELWEKQR